VPGSLDPVALALSAGAAIAVFRFRLGMMPVLAAWAGLGLAGAVVSGSL
jgi:chromate transporter